MSRFTDVLLAWLGLCRGALQTLQPSKYYRRGIHIYTPVVLFHDDVMAHRKTESGAFTRRFSREEGIEYLFFYFGRYSGAIVTDADLDLVTKILRRGGQRRLEAITSIRFALRCRVESI